MTTIHDKQKFYRAMVSACDFSEARSYLDAIQESTSNQLRDAAVLAAVVAYCRPFQKSDPGHGDKSKVRTTLNPKDVLSNSEVNFHNQLIT